MAKIIFNFSDENDQESFESFCESDPVAVEFICYDLTEDEFYIDCSDNDMDHYLNQLNEIFKLLGINDSSYTLRMKSDELSNIDDENLNEAVNDVFNNSKAYREGIDAFDNNRSRSSNPYKKSIEDNFEEWDEGWTDAEDQYLRSQDDALYGNNKGKHFKESKKSRIKRFDKILIENKNNHFFVTKAKFLVEAINQKDPQLEKIARFSRDYNDLTIQYKELTKEFRNSINKKSKKTSPIKKSLKEAIEGEDAQFVNVNDLFTSVVSVISSLGEAAGELQQHKAFVFKSDNQKQAIGKLESQLLSTLTYANDILGGLSGMNVEQAQ